MTVRKDIPEMICNYQLTCSERTPQLIVFLLDRGRNMAESFQEETKMEMACRTINRIIKRLTILNFDGHSIRNPYHIAVLSYGEDYLELCSGTLSDLFDNPLRIVEKMREIADGAGGFVTVPVRSEIFVDAEAQKSDSNLHVAILFAKSYIEKWLSDKNCTPAPIVVNVSDGRINGVSFIDNVSNSIQALRSSSTFDGPSLFYSMIIGSDVDISVLDNISSTGHHAPMQELVSNVPNNHC